jgi:shikimate dehydrogenase
VTDEMNAERASEGKIAELVMLTGLIGMDIQGSRSRAMHETEAAAQGFPLRYHLFDLAVAGACEADLASTLAEAERAGFAGVNVTHPFKQQVMALLDHVSDEAQAIGAVNTVVFRDGKRTGYNTDSSGFVEGFQRQLGGAELAHVVQIGAGGAGAATAMAMVGLGCKDLVIIDVQAERAAELVLRLPGNVARVGSDVAGELASADGLINATPIGMQGHAGMPVDAALLHAGLWVADVVYFPLETELLKTAQALGCRTANGGDMAVFQAARAFDLFTGHQADRERMVASF